MDWVNGWEGDMDGRVGKWRREEVGIDGRGVDRWTVGRGTE